jgi:TatA/E family protein of Tat protein translocase
MNLGPAEIGLIVLAVMLLFGYKKLPDASRSLGRSLRIFKGEVDGLRDAATVSDETSQTYVAEPQRALDASQPSAGGGTRTPTPEGTRS